MHYIRHLRQPLIRARDWRPAGQIEVNDDHWLRSKLVSLFAPENSDVIVDLINPGLVLSRVTNNPRPRDGRLGRAAWHDDASSAAFKGTANSPFAASGLPDPLSNSILVLGEPISTSLVASFAFQFGSSSGTAAFQAGGQGNTSPQYFLRTLNSSTSVNLQSSAVPFQVNVPILWGGSSLANNDHRLFVNGLQRGTTSTVSLTGRSTLGNVGTADIRQAGTSGASSFIRYLMLATYPAIQPDEHMRLFEEGAFGLILPKVERSYYFYAPLSGAPAFTGSFADQLAARPIATGARGASGSIADQVASRPIGAGTKAATAVTADALRLAPVAAGARAAAGIIADQLAARPVAAGTKASTGTAAERLTLAETLSGAAGTGDARFGSFADTFAGRPAGGGAKAATGAAPDALRIAPVGLGARGAAGTIAERLMLRPAAGGARQAGGVSHLVLRVVEGFTALAPIEIPDRFELDGVFGEVPIGAVWEPHVQLQGVAA